MAYEVTKEDTFDCAIRFIQLGYNPLILDFASGSNPGGGWRGKQTGTQEESLCKRSNLGLLLEQKKYPIPDLGYHYVKNVIITKDINMKPIAPIKCAVIASELKGISERSQKYLETKIELWYEVARNNKHNAIILGAVGCGAFKETNDDCDILASVIRRVAERNQDILSVYAIYKGKQNYNVFKDKMK